MSPQTVDYASPPPRVRGWRWLRGRFARWHAWTAIALWLIFTGLTLAVLLEFPGESAGWGSVIIPMAATVLGPMTGAFFADFQSCCLKFSLTLLPYCLGALVFAIAVQLFVPPRGSWLRIVRALAWLAGLFIHFAGGIMSFGHALS